MELNNWIGTLTTGMLLGLTAGISPGPLLALVISETLKHGRREGIRISLTPLVTDFPIILFSLIVVTLFARSQVVLTVIAFLGGIFVAYLGYECLSTKGLTAGTQKSKPQSLSRGIVVNILNPHPYLFWITVGAPLVMKARQTGVTAVVLFLAGFYFCLVGSKVTIALLTERSKGFLNNTAYVWIMRILGLSLLVFAGLFILDGIRMVKLLYSLYLSP